MTQQRGSSQLLESICQLLEENLAELKHLRVALATTASRSSVEITSGTSGKPFGLSVKVYADSPVIEAEAEAVQSFCRLRAELEQRVLDGWQQTVTEGKAKWVDSR